MNVRELEWKKKWCVVVVAPVELRSGFIVIMHNNTKKNEEFRNVLVQSTVLIGVCKIKIKGS